MVAAYLLGMDNILPVHPSVTIVWSFNMAYLVWTYLEGLRVNVQVSTKKHRFWPRAFAFLSPMIVLIGVVEAVGGLRGLVDVLKKRNTVGAIDKPL